VRVEKMKIVARVVSVESKRRENRYARTRLNAFAQQQARDQNKKRKSRTS
jgi:hypothetical protein